MDILVEITIRAYAGEILEPTIKELNFCVPMTQEGDESSVVVPDMRNPVQSAIEVAAYQAMCAEIKRVLAAQRESEAATIKSAIDFIKSGHRPAPPEDLGPDFPSIDVDLEASRT